MPNFKKIYQGLLPFILALYIYLGKGIAYSYLAEMFWIVGLILIIIERRNINIIMNTRSVLLIIFLLLNILYIIRGLFHYSILDVIRDSFIFNYLLFSFIIFLYYDNYLLIIDKILKIYKYYPFVISILYLLSLNSFIGNITIFGQNHLLFFKFGDILVHLFISLIFLLCGYYKQTKIQYLFFIGSVVFLFFIGSSYSRGGMVSFLLALFLFFLSNKDLKIKTNLSIFFRYLLLSLIIIIPIIFVLPKDENFQGRKTGLDQISTNVTSIISNEEQGSLSDNKIWRLLWWAKIIDYTFGGEYFINGKGLGMSLAQDDDIIFESNDAELRSPHNFHLSILARYGVPIFCSWIFWLFLSFRRLVYKNLSTFKLVLITLQIAFIFNASFDVFLEGPMGAFPFWIFIGLDLLSDSINLDQYLPNNELNILNAKAD